MYDVYTQSNSDRWELEDYSDEIDLTFFNDAQEFRYFI